MHNKLNNKRYSICIKYFLVMPLISISTSENIIDKNKLLKNASKLLSDLTNKSENFVMVKLIESLPMYFASSHKPCCYVEINSIGALDPSKMAKIICEFVSLEIGIQKDRIYIKFQDVEPSMWAWNGEPFG